MAHASQFSDITLDEMQFVYGEGYLSPGGAKEVDAILDGVTARRRRVLDLGGGVTVRGRRVLDLDCGVGARAP